MSDLTVRQRLLNGAKVLGSIWNSGARCASVWSLRCDCLSPSKFCQAKRQWVALLMQDDSASDREIASTESPFGLIESMLSSEFENAGLTLVFGAPEFGEVKVGPAGLLEWRELAGISLDPESAKSVLKILTKFPGSKIVEGGSSA